MDDPRYAPPKADIQASVPPDGQPSGLGGWLILVALGLVIAPIRIAYMLATNHWPIFQGDTWSQLTTPGSPAYHALWAPLLVFEVAGNLLLIVLGVWTLLLFVGKSRKTPKFAIAWYASAAGVVLVDHLVAGLIPAVASQPDADSTRELVRALLGAAIWIPYFRLSKRVKNTFVR